MVDIVVGVVQVVADGGGWSHSTDGGTGAPGPQNRHSLVLAFSSTRVKPNVSVQAGGWGSVTNELLILIQPVLFRFLDVFLIDGESKDLN